MVEAGTLCTNGNVGYMAGANCSATATAEAFTNVVILLAEGIIKEETSYDWVANYASVNANRKEALRAAAASLAAMFVISYDMSGTSQREMETRLDVLINTYNKAIANLKGKGTS